MKWLAQPIDKRNFAAGLQILRRSGYKPNIHTLLLRKGELVGDCTIDELEEQGKDLMTYVKETYRYQNDRVSRLLCGTEDDKEG